MTGHSPAPAHRHTALERLHAEADDASPPVLPAGPALVYVAPDGTPTTIDETAVDGPRDRVLCRALLRHAGKLLDDAEQQHAKNPVGFA
ncbi:hypothetical protein RVR_10587 [Actinacidiphila reveromycinica]|uniref:Uncharacterized protein n=1 Tax=Actinacidiphila reveromycinica TaxID=659352 RepID=A0A7U3VRA5_9ACTN|nr:hypothetical protein [Streptomyces sp. SN-593]BBB00588.1 hypothetical protein RVR_7721 [Streptomyces sp. SN-593]BBB00641.1 hypothetical protein RVR_10587 [Streptomyces sp. SN-593]